MSTVTERVIKVVTDQLNVKASDVHSNSSFRDDLGADSLDSVELVMAFEEEFGTEISDEEAEKLTTIQQVVDYIEKRLSEKEKA